MKTKRNKKLNKMKYTFILGLLFSCSIFGQNDNNSLKEVCEGDCYRGFGILIELFNDSIITKYSGYWNKGMKNGEGTLRSFRGNFTYSGNWLNDNYDGFGILKTENSKYEGQWRYSQKHGNGNAQLQNGDIYNGEWYKDDISGYGVYYFKNGDRYEGDFKYNQKHGVGTYYYANNNRFEGNYRNGVRHGKDGILYFDNGDQYQGEFNNNDEFHGNGSMNYTNGSRYNGTWQNNLFHGNGEYLLDNGDSYLGEFAQGDKEGYGIYKWSNGDLYQGQFINDLQYGNGLIIYNNGDKFEGKFKSGIYDGFGAYTWVNGDKNIGEFVEGNFNIKNGEFISLNEIVNNNKTMLYIQENKIDDIKINQLPILEISDVKFIDQNNNNSLDANEEIKIRFNISNNGEGIANKIKVNINKNNDVNGLIISDFDLIDKIRPYESKPLEISITGLLNLESSFQSITISVTELNGFDADPIEINFETKEITPPDLSITDYQFISESGVLNISSPITLNIVLQNLGKGVAENVFLNFLLPSNVFSTGETEFYFKTLNPGESKLVSLNFFTNKRYNLNTISLKAIVKEKNNKYGIEKSISERFNNSINSETSFNVKSINSQTEANFEIHTITSQVDKKIPIRRKIENRYALIIGNEDYKTYQSGLSTEQNVDFAENDAEIFKEYALKTLGVKKDNLYLLKNATAGQMKQKIALVSKIIKAEGSNAELIFYYAGHGYPDEITKVPYLIPVDISASDLSSAINLADLYNTLAQTQAKRITVFLDACFTGGARSQGLVASRGIKISPKQEALDGNIVVFSASSETQSSLPYYDQMHGMFTYYLLEKLQESEGKCTYNELFNSVNKKVTLNSLKFNEKEQNPKVNTGQNVNETWGNWKF